ncbi:CapA family protein [Neobacillus novalis]|uniref:CapA family protein n=1 Tax=Neobacillus novalis TaxID=220687 RepID=A0AA95MW88_9BACI|nr:CapA family protein [Neobacillus novalis]WHY88838.1 CapA family protein [Neobacillus novalis]
MNKKDSSGKKTRRERHQSKGTVRFVILAVILILAGSLIYANKLKSEHVSSKVSQAAEKATEKVKEEEPKQEVEVEEKPEIQPKPEIETMIKISAAGDFTLGTDESFTYSDSFVKTASVNGLPYFVEGLDKIFLEDDFTTVNLETTLTNATQKAEKTFRFKGDPSYAKILVLGGIEAVNLANNHSHDYLEKGYNDTISALKNQNIGYFGYDHQYITTIKGIKVGALGYEGWSDTKEIRQKVEQDIKNLRNQGVQIVLIHYHWGNESQYVPNESQKSLAHFTIDSGADLILGHHPHVVQGIEEYNGKFIVYSLGNFMFGGNRNPRDKDTYVFQQTFQLKNGVLTDKKEINVVPYSISSVSSRNNYQPTKLTGVEQERVKKKIIEGSNKINGSDWLVYENQQEVVQKDE